MKKRNLTFLFLFFSLVFTSNASHYMGGEITWQCLGNGNYRFIMKLYRECNGVTFSNSEILTVSNYPGLATISMNLKPGANPLDGAEGRPVDGKTDLSPNCWNPSQEIRCYPNPAMANTGAVEEWYFTSDQAYPNGVKLTGVPPPIGWIFSHNSCCRNPCGNIVNATSNNWFLRAIMYRFNYQNAFPCYDNSPTFAENVAPVLCNGTNYIYNNRGIDIEYDSLGYEWAPALNGNLTTPVTYTSGYSYNSPLPSKSMDPQNVPAVLNPSNGEISYTTYTYGAFVMVIKVSEYRHGWLIAEIFREIQTVIIPCDANNLSPIMAAPFYNPQSGMMELTDTVNMGDIVDFDMMATDNGVLPNGNLQTMSLEASGMDFGTGFTNPNAGCIHPPCATLNPPPIVTSMLAVGTHFHWQTACSHMQPVYTDNNFAYSPHYFYFKASDNWCPAPASITKKVTIVIKTPLIKSMIGLVTNYFTMITWNNSGYLGMNYIYRSDNNYPFVLLDSTLYTVYTDFTSVPGHNYRYKILVTNDTTDCNMWSTVCSTDDWTGIESHEADNSISIYPNPANDQLFVDIVSFESQPMDISVLNCLGAQAMHDVYKLVPGNNKFMIPTAALSQGVYVIKLQTKQLTKNVKVFIQH